MKLYEKYLTERNPKATAKAALETFLNQNDKFNDAKNRAEAIGDKNLIVMFKRFHNEYMKIQKYVEKMN